MDDEKQEVATGNSPTGGSFTLTVFAGGQVVTSDAYAYDVPAEEVASWLLGVLSSTPKRQDRAWWERALMRLRAMWRQK